MISVLKTLVTTIQYVNFFGEEAKFREKKNLFILLIITNLFFPQDLTLPSPLDPVIAA